MIENCKKFLSKGSKTFSRTINLLTVESTISKELGLIQKKYIKNIEIGSYPFFRVGKIGVSVVLRSENKKFINLVAKEVNKVAKNKRLKIFKY